MNEEIDEFDFYHQDFTTASEWEVFIARIEEILNDFNLSKVKSPLAQECDNPEKCSTELSFYGSLFTLSYYNDDVSEVETVDVSETNLSKSKRIGNKVLGSIWEEGFKFVDDTDKSWENPIPSWYGLKRYLILRPAAPLCDENQIKLIMSSVNIALANSECRVPFFVKIREDWQQCYQGIFEDGDFRTQFDTIHLKRIPSQCYHLSGLLNLFKGKISSPQALEPVEMAAKFSYNMKDLEIFAWRRPRHNDVFANGFELSQWIGLPVGAAKNCIKYLYLHVMWPKFFEDAVIDSPSYSDFDPLMAPVWTVSCETEDNFPCILQEILAKFFDLLSNSDLVMDSIGMSKNLGILNPLNRITETPSISKLVKSALSSSSSNQTTQDFKGPLSDDYLMPLLYYIFPDAVEDHSSPYPEHLEVDRKEDDSCTLKACSYIKSSPVDGLVWRLSIILARLLDIGGLSWLAHFWYEFTQELQYRWDNKILIPGVSEGTPNARTCLLHQKLQLINCCVQRAQAASTRDDERGSSSGEDEFYDCAEDEEEGAPPVPPAPVGRLCRLGDAATAAGEPLYVPVTQEPAPKTEEQLEEDAELMLRLGDGARASELRARMMSASLLSDMESFKAANPGAELADFVRWYSPRDFDATAPGRLSERMLLPGNPWEDAWRTARPLPAARQRRLFDERREAERALHYLRARTAADVAELVLPSLLRAGARALATAGAGGAGPPPGCESRRLYELAATELAEAEAAWARRARLSAALDEAAPGAPLDAAARTRLAAAAGAPPARREFVMRVRDARAPHLMRALLAGDLQLVAAFTEPTVFMN